MERPENGLEVFGVGRVDEVLEGKAQSLAYLGEREGVIGVAVVGVKDALKPKQEGQRGVFNEFEVFFEEVGLVGGEGLVGVGAELHVALQPVAEVEGGHARTP